jgi:hypothetical protein
VGQPEEQWCLQQTLRGKDWYCKAKDELGREHRAEELDWNVILGVGFGGRIRYARTEETIMSKITRYKRSWGLRPESRGQRGLFYYNFSLSMLSPFLAYYIQSCTYREQGSSSTPWQVGEGVFWVFIFPLWCQIYINECFHLFFLESGLAESQPLWTSKVRPI